MQHVLRYGDMPEGSASQVLTVQSSYSSQTSVIKTVLTTATTSELPKIFLCSDAPAHQHAHFCQIAVWVSCSSDAYQTSAARADETMRETDNTLERKCILCVIKSMLHISVFLYTAWENMFLYLCSGHNNIN